jgi:polyisoprenoid-binding protein YceI
MVSASRITLPTLLYGVIPWPNIPGVAGLAPGAKTAWHEVGEASHVWLSYLLYGLFALHVAGALKHQLLSRDEPILGRMAPGAVAGRWFDPRLIAIVVGVAAVVLFGWTVKPPPPGMSPPVHPAAEPAPAPEPAASPSEATTSAPTPQAAPPAAAPAPSGPVKWAVQPGSTLGFATSWGGQGLSGRFKRWSANIAFSPDALDRSKVTVAIDLASVDTGDGQRDAVLPSADWFDVANHPKAVFTATKFEKTGGDNYVAHGTLQIRGVTKPQDLPFKLNILGDEAQVHGTTALDRTAFGIGQGEFAATDQVPAKVTITVALRAKRAGG